MYDVNGFPPTSTSTRRSPSRGTTWTKSGPRVCAAADGAPPTASATDAEIKMRLVSRIAALDRRGGRHGSGRPQCLLATLAGQHAAHVRERLLHPGERIVGVDLVLEVDVARVPDPLQGAEQRRNREHAFADDALAVLVHR